MTATNDKVGDAVLVYVQSQGCGLLFWAVNGDAAIFAGDMCPGGEGVGRCSQYMVGLPRILHKTYDG